MFITAVQTGIVIAAIVGASFTAPVVVDDVPPDDATTTAVRAPRPGDVIETIAELLGASRGDVVSTLRTGGTLAELAADQGSSGDALASALLQSADDRIDDALASGTIDEARAADLRAAAADRVDRLVSEPHRRVRRPGLGGELRRDIIGAVEDELDLPLGRIVSYLRTGGTLAELADDTGSSGDDLVATMLAVIDQRVQQALADGRIDEDRGAELLEIAEARLVRVVFEVHVPGRSR